jgi:adenine-specific DNA methylase
MRYYGCKTKLLGYIENVIKSLPLKKGDIFFDIFSGTSAVGQHFKKLGFTVYSNDFLEFCYALAYCYIQINSEPKFKKLNKYLNTTNDANSVINQLNKINGEIGFITKNYSPYGKNTRRYLSIDNAKRVDAIRNKINSWMESKLISKSEYYYLITALVEAINLVSNVTGTYAAYLKNWDNRALKPIKLIPPKIIKSINKNLAIKGDANKIISQYKVDALYLDPPYNSRQFASNYFFLELIAEGWFGKKPNIYGRTGMRPYDKQKSKYSMKNKAAKALVNLINDAKAKYIIMSYNDEGIIPLGEIRKILKMKGDVQEFTREHKRYRAINQDGSHVQTHELLFLVKVKR